MLTIVFAPWQLPQRRLVERRVGGDPVVVDDADGPVRRVDVDPWEPLVGGARVDELPARSTDAPPFVEVIRKTSVFVTGFATSCDAVSVVGEDEVQPSRLARPRARDDVARRVDANLVTGQRLAAVDVDRVVALSRPRARRRRSGSTTSLRRQSTSRASTDCRRSLPPPREPRSARSGTRRKACHRARPSAPRTDSRRTRRPGRSSWNVHRLAFDPEISCGFVQSLPPSS